MGLLGIQSFIGGAAGWGGTKPVIPEAIKVSPNTMNAEQLANVATLMPRIKDLAAQYGKFETNQLLKSWEKMLPGFSGMTGQATGLASSYMKGEIPSDVVNAIKDATAAASRSTGTAGSSFSFANNTRSLGLTSLDLTTKGANLYQNLAGMFMPYAPLRGFAQSQIGSITPLSVNQRASMEQWNAQQAFNRQMMENIKDAMPSPQDQAWSSGMDELFGQLGTALGALGGMGGLGSIGGMGLGAAGGGLGASGNTNQAAINSYLNQQPTFVSGRF